MMTRSLRVVACCLGIAISLSACGSGIGGGLMDKAVPPAKQHILENPDKVTLFTILSDYDLSPENEVPEFSDLDVFGKYERMEFRVLDRVELDEDETDTLISAFSKAVKQGEEGGVKCFAPHHALRIEKDGEQLDILVCFMCHNYLVHPDGGYNNVRMSKEVGMEEAWREVVRAHALKDISDDE